MSPLFLGPIPVPPSPEGEIIPSLPHILVIAVDRILRGSDTPLSVDAAQCVISALHTLHSRVLIPIDLLSRMRLLFHACPFSVINVCFEEFASRLSSKQLVCKILLSASAMRIRPVGGPFAACLGVLAHLFTSNNLPCTPAVVHRFLRVSEKLCTESLRIYHQRFYCHVKVLLYSMSVVYGISHPAYSLSTVLFTRQFQPIMDAFPRQTFDFDPAALLALRTAESLPPQSSVGRGTLLPASFSLDVVRVLPSDSAAVALSLTPLLTSVGPVIIDLVSPSGSPASGSVLSPASPAMDVMSASDDEAVTGVPPPPSVVRADVLILVDDPSVAGSDDDMPIMVDDSDSSDSEGGLAPSGGAQRLAAAILRKKIPSIDLAAASPVASSPLSPPAPSSPLPTPLPFPLDPPPLPPYKGFAQNVGIIAALKFMTSQSNVNVRSLRRWANEYIISQTGDPTVDRPVKPHAEDVHAMAASGNLRSGAVPLPPGTSPLRVDEISRMHLMHCPHCQQESALLSQHPPQLSPTCYIGALLRTVTHGYDPGLDPSTPVTPRTPYKGNGPSTQTFPSATAKAMSKLISRGYVRPATAEERRLGHPVAINVVLKNSDLHRARAATGLEITSESSLAAANAALERQGLRSISARAVFDYKSNGVNDSLDKFPFSQPGIFEATATVEKDGYNVIEDCDSYFNQFATAQEFSPYTLFFFQGVWYVALRLLFGVRTAPHLGFTWAAEMHAFFVSQGIRHTVMQDDHCVGADSYAEAVRLRAFVVTTLNAYGFRISPDKSQLAQKFTYIGFRIDTVSMSMTIVPESARSFLFRLEALEAFARDAADIPSLAELTSMTGCMVNFSQLLQVAMTYVYWMYELLGSYPYASSVLRCELSDVCTYFREVLTPWAADVPSGREFPILNKSVFSADTESIICVQTDASGLQDHGYGGFSGYLHTLDPMAWARLWYMGSRTSHSHGQELEAFLNWLLLQDFDNKLIFWVTDCSGAALSANKGSCHNPESLPILRQIFTQLDARRNFLVSFWDRRTEADAQWADYLTHLASSLGRNFDGPLSSVLPRSSAPPGSSPSGDTPRSPRRSDVRSVHTLLSPSSYPLEAALVLVDRDLSLPLCGEEPGFGQEFVVDPGPSSQDVSSYDKTLGLRDQVVSSSPSDQGASVPGRDALASERASPVRANSPHPRRSVSFDPGPDVFYSPSDGLRRAPAARRAPPLPPCLRRGLDKQAQFQTPPVPNKDSPTGVSDLDHLSPEIFRTLRCQGPAKVVLAAQPLEAAACPPLSVLEEEPLWRDLARLASSSY